MEILHFCPLPAFSGLEQYALMLARMQRDQGKEVGFVVLRGSALETECAKAGLPIFVVDFDAGTSPFGAALQYKRILFKHPEIDVIHLHTSQDIDRIWLTKLLLARRPWPKVVQQNHIWISAKKRDPVHWLMYRVLDEMWCSSEPARRDLLKNLPIPESKVHIIKYGRDIAYSKQSFLSREEARAALKIPAQATVLGAIARIDWHKGVWELLNGALNVMKSEQAGGAGPAAPSALGSDLHLVIIGGPTLTDPKAIKFDEDVRKLVEGLTPELRSRVHLTGGLPEAGRYLKAFDLYAQVAHKETFSLALLDAQLAGLPVLGTNSGGTPEVVREASTGWLCEPINTDSLTDALKRALADRAKWQQYGATASARVEREFDINAVMAEILKRYGV